MINMPDEIEETDEQFKQRIFECIRATITQCFIDDHGHPPPRPAPDSVIRDIVFRITDMGAPSNMDEVIEKTKRIYRATANMAAMRRGVN